MGWSRTLVSPAAAPADQPRWWGPNQRRPAAPSIRICRHPVDLWTARRGAAHNPTGSTTEKEAYIGLCATHSKVKRGEKLNTLHPSHTAAGGVSSYVVFGIEGQIALASASSQGMRPRTTPIM